MKIGNVELQEMGGVHSAMCLVSPANAARLLERNTRNRKASPSVIDRYVTEMMRDEWLPTGSGIGFDEGGVLLDGQQRLMAVVESKKTVPILVTSHLPPRSQEKVDRQRKRTLFDVFSIFESASCREAVQIATFLARWAKGKGGNTWIVPADSEVRDCLRLHNDALEVVAPMGRTKEHGVTRVGVLAAVTLAWEKHGDQAKAFFESVRSETHSDRMSPCLRLRTALINTKGHGGGGWTAQLEVFERTCYAFNAYHAKRGIAAVYRAQEIE